MKYWEFHGSYRDWKTWKNRHFPVREKSGKFTKNTGKRRKNYTGIFLKYCKGQGNLSASNSENMVL